MYKFLSFTKKMTRSRQTLIIYKKNSEINKEIPPQNIYMLREREEAIISEKMWEFYSQRDLRSNF